MKTTAGVLLLIDLAGGPLLVQDVAIKTLLSKGLAGSPGKELTMITVDYRPGAADPVHTHNAHAMVYVLEGSVVMQVEGKAPATLVPGQTFYEQPGHVHTVASERERHRARQVRRVLRKRPGRADSHSHEMSQPPSAHARQFSRRAHSPVRDRFRRRESAKCSGNPCTVSWPSNRRRGLPRSPAIGERA